MTLRELASAIRNHIVDGLKGVTNEAFSIEQLMQEIVLESETLIIQGITQRTVQLGSISQRIDGIEVVCEDTSGNCAIDSQVVVPHISIPKLSQMLPIYETLSFIGPLDNSTTFKVYNDTDFRFHKYNQATSNRPYVWVNTSGKHPGMYDIYFYNLGKYNNLKYVSVVALFENPASLLKTPYANQFSNSEFYAPSSVQKQIIDSLTQKYVNYYRQLNRPVEPNTQEKQ